jgi:hypothetical protein
MLSRRHKYVPRAFMWLYSLTHTRPVFETDIRMDELHELIDNRNPIEASEFEFVERMSRPSRTIENVKLAVKALIGIYLIKAVHCCYFMLFKYKAFSVESRLAIGRDSSTGQPLYNFACITSNCSTLFDPLVNATRSQLIMDELPVLPICHPFLSKFNELAQSTNLRGTFVMLVSSCICIVSLILQWKLSKIPTRNQLLMFLVAPNISHRLILTRTKMHVENLNRPLLHQMRWARPLVCNRSGAIRNLLDVFGLQSNLSRSARLQADATAQTKQDPSGVNKCQFVHDCFPLVRSEHWRRQLSDVLLFLSIITLIWIITFFGVFLWFTNVYLERQRQALGELQLEIDRSTCSIWRKRTNEMIDITSFQLDFNAYGLLSSFVVVVALPCWSIMAPLQVVLISSWELRCLICELKYKIIMLLPAIKHITDAMLLERASFKSSHRNSYLQNGYNGRLECTMRKVDGRQPATNEFKYDKLREKFMKDVRAVPLALLNKPLLGHQIRLETQAFIINECLDDQFKSPASLAHWPTTLAELVEKLYVQFRVADDLLAEASPSISVVTGIGAVLCYSVFLVSFVMCKLAVSTLPEQYMLMSICLLCVIFLTLNSAILRSKVSCWRAIDADFVLLL